ncbi:ribosome maturation factor RimP [Rhodococcus sp. ACPA4]|jgi:ribosome maturation factor RimP|uniref:Ribosome maturation factor RimP n=1 Tax=Nocardia globerula TaxID=1818 RepID=A0A652YKG2_NOCGL|nr:MULTISPECIES: ribosome maturation factor RimP [Rhodococcus]NMD61748.1 ribosome maturation factor RimP [Nocardia globerula]KJF22197.1 Ribosome maturation factor RimP [Rhodococcus sp. AD45]MCE4268695.1 ribosome maturation factor RimP [Rhodococcus globerulus]MDV8067856.1 ribosome maturation factor RimP [Rhodococcus sp. IEGM 1366]NRI64000.1 ribosome maturation factor RimP [Rhodococcus sp. MS16]
MPVPSKDRVIELVSELVQSKGYDVEDVVVTNAGKHSAVRIMVDSDAGIELDAAAEISRLVSELFDSLEEIGEAPYTLEVTSPGIDRPLTAERHWRRARGRKARIDLADETVVGRIGVLGEDSVAVVMNGRGGLTVREIPLADVQKAVVQVEFSKPSDAELELAGGIPEGRAVHTDLDESDAQVLDSEEDVEDVDNEEGFDK